MYIKDEKMPIKFKDYNKDIRNLSMRVDDIH